MALKKVDDLTRIFLPVAYCYWHACRWANLVCKCVLAHFSTARWRLIRCAMVSMFHSIRRSNMEHKPFDWWLIALPHPRGHMTSLPLLTGVTHAVPAASVIGVPDWNAHILAYLHKLCISAFPVERLWLKMLLWHEWGWICEKIQVL